MLKISAYLNRFFAKPQTLTDSLPKKIAEKIKIKTTRSVVFVL